MATTRRKLRSQNADPYQEVIHIRVCRDIKLYHYIIYFNIICLLFRSIR